MGTRRLVQASWAALLLLLALPQFAAGASDLEASLPRKWMKGMTTPFCGSCCCSVEDEQKLQEAFLAEVKAHGYHDAECRSELKKYMCAVCLQPSAPVADDTLISTTTINSSLPLRCAGVATVTHNSISMAPTAQPPSRQRQLRPRNTKKLLPKWLIPAILAVLVLFGGGGYYLVHNMHIFENCRCYNNFVSINCWCCCHSRTERPRNQVPNRGS